MALNAIFDIAGSAMTAQSMRLTTTASNMSNADVVASSAAKAYRPRYPIFASVQSEANGFFEDSKPGVKVAGILESSAQPLKRYQPNHPMADKEGYVYAPNVNVVEEMTNMISASRSYQMNIEVMNTAKELMMRTLQLGQ